MSGGGGKSFLMNLVVLVTQLVRDNLGTGTLPCEVTTASFSIFPKS